LHRRIRDVPGTNAASFTIPVFAGTVPTIKVHFEVLINCVFARRQRDRCVINSRPVQSS